MSAPFRGSCGCVQFSVARVGAGGWLLLAACVVAANSGMLVAAEPKTKPDPSLLTVQRLFGSSEFESESFQARWLNGEAAYTILEKSADPAGGRDIVRVDAKTGDKTVMVSAARLLPDDESQPLSIQGYAFSDDTARVLIYTNSQRVWRRKTRGDYWVLDRSSGELRQLGGEAPAASLMFAKFSPNGRHVAYVRSGNIYLEDLLDGRITALTQSASPDIINGTFDWVYEEELGLDDGFRWSKDGQSIAYWEINTTGVREFPLIRNTDGLYPRIVNIKYPKAGQTNSACRVGVVDIQSRKTTWINTPGDPRQNYIARMEWAEDSDNLILQHFNRLQNQNRVILADPRTGNVHTILTERDEAWVDVHDELFWFDNGWRFSWISERDGWRHIYVATRDGQSLERVTSGEYDVIQLLAVDEAHECVYFMASPENPTEQYLYKIGLDGHGLERITPPEAAGTHSYSLSNDQQWAIHTFSTMDSPTTIDLIKTDGHTTVRTLAKNSTLQKRVEKLKRTPTEFFRVEIAEGLALDAWCIKPPNFSANKKYPLLIYVYGEPAGQTVLNRWGGSRALWHVMLAQQGYVVMSFDNRGTPAPRGRDWRKCIYRQVGDLAPKDQAAAVKKVLAERAYLDPKRVGIWGWSGGGSMTLNALFKFPKLYQVGISIAPVPNEALYDTIYQERYMGLPHDNVAGYRQGSSVNFAHQFAGKLLLIHGTGDDNVHYQGSEGLMNELIRLNKPFEMMIYPNRTHSIREGKNTQVHMRELMTRFLHEHLPASK